jgi:L-seryl-tRNA(Ser) seleniumtransferase
MAATLALYQDPAEAVRAIPVLAMLTVSPEELAQRATRLVTLCPPAVHPRTMPGESAVGGGAFPGAVLPTTLVALDAGPLGPDGLALRLRLGTPPVVARVADNRVLLDPRTLPEDSLHLVARAIESALLS